MTERSVNTSSYREGVQPMHECLFSIIVPVYNAEEFLDECILSVMKQSYTNWELILVDDSSKDSSLSICKKYASLNERIKCYHKANSGQYETRRFGMGCANGDYCVFLDSDDELFVNALEVIHSYIVKHDADCIIYGLERKSQDGIIDKWTNNTARLLTDRREVFKEILSSQKYNSLCRKAVKTCVLHQCLDIEHEIVYHGEDLLQSLDILLHSASILFVPDILYSYRFNANSVSHNYKISKFLKDSLYLKAQVVALLKDNQIFNKEDFKQLSDIYAVNIIDIIRETISTEDPNEYIVLFDELKRNTFFADFINGQRHSIKEIGAKSLVLRWFNKGQYRRIWLLEKLITVVRLIRSWKK